MIQGIIDTAIKFLLPIILGYCLSIIKNYKKKNDATTNALKIMLQNNLTNTYYVYSSKKKIPDYVYKNWLNMLKEYENLDGDDFIHILAEKMKTWDFTKTDILE